MFRGCTMTLHGVVSLLDMLRFAAERFYKLSEELSRVSQDVAHLRPLVLGGAGTPLSDVKDLTLELGLDSAYDQILRIYATLPKEQGIIERLFADLHRRVHDDLKRKLVYCVEAERNKFCDPQWLVESPIFKKFPTAFKELQSAGRCYAFGEGPASAFHSMRALEIALGVLAARFNVDFQNTNWHPVIEEIESKIRDISKAPKSQQRLDDEKFFGGLGRHFMFLKNGWRNHVMHVRDNYTDREARQMLDHLTDLLMEMSQQLSE
jgi:hypothetical protein